jgi:hypothetical protein
MIPIEIHIRRPDENNANKILEVYIAFEKYFA